MTNNQLYYVITLQAQDFLRILEVMEETLAESLRKMCGYYGDEKKAHLKESSEILFSMGRLYMKKAEITKGMDQKLNFIKAAALLHGAKVRFEKFAKNTSKKLNVVKLLEDMEKLIMVASGGEMHCRSLLETSESIAIKFQHFRDDERENLKLLEIIDESVPEDEAKKRQLHKISLVRKLLKQNSENYKELMNEIAKEILQIFGFPPCEFTIAGLGSLAREEITLYSDFEHVIILEEGVQKREYFENVREYFRWFSVLFHIIVIGVGETVLPSVGIQSLNDFYSGDKTKNWFYDSYTPVGVSFDGMMPHACKTPLGRQHTTERKSHIVELIQPVGKMLKYLTSEENLKNGYCLKDILYQSCFLFGSKAVYDSFNTGAEKMISLDSGHDSMESLSRKVTENVNSSVKGDRGLFQNPLEAIDSKPSFYRPLSTLLCYLARLYHIKATSGFDKIQECREQSEHRISLMWAFAVACEIRLKLYAMKSGNRKKILGREILNYVGKPCLINCVSAITDLSRFFMKPRLHSEHIFRRWPDSEAQAQLFIGDHIDMRDSVKQGMKEAENPYFYGMLDPGQFTASLASSYLIEFSSTHDEEKRADLLKKAKDIILSDGYSIIYPQSLHVLAGVYSLQGQDEKALEVAESIFSLIAVPAAVTGDQVLIFRETQVDAAWNSMGNADSIKYYNRFLSCDLDYPSRLMFLFALARSQFHSDKKAAGIETLKSLFEDLKSGGRESTVVSKLGIVRLLHEIFRIQFCDNLIEDCYKTLIMAEEIIESGPGQVNITILAPQFVSLFAANTYLLEAFRIQEPESQKFELFEKAARICTMPANLSICEHDLCYALSGMLQCSANNFKAFPIHKVRDILTKIPKTVRDNTGVKTYVLIKFVNMLGNYVDNPSDDDLLESLNGAEMVVEFMQELHPMLSCLLVSLIEKASRKLRVNFYRLILREVQDDLELKKYQTLDDMREALAKFKSMIDLQWLRWFHSQVRGLWKLFIAGETTKSLIFTLLGYIYGSQCLYVLVNLRVLMTRFYEVNRLPSCKLTPEYHLALQCYMQRDYNCSARKFWRIAILAKNGCLMQKRCIRYLHWTIMYSLNRYGYRIPVKQNFDSEVKKLWKGPRQTENLNVYSPGFF